jgi:hypothetical protein
MSRKKRRPIHEAYGDGTTCGRTIWDTLEQTLAAGSPRRDDRAVEPPIEHRDVTTIMASLGDIKNDVNQK